METLSPSSSLLGPYWSRRRRASSGDKPSSSAVPSSLMTVSYVRAWAGPLNPGPRSEVECCFSLDIRDSREAVLNRLRGCSVYSKAQRDIFPRGGVGYLRDLVPSRGSLWIWVPQTHAGPQLPIDFIHCPIGLAESLRGGGRYWRRDCCLGHRPHPAPQNTPVVWLTQGKILCQASRTSTRRIGYLAVRANCDTIDDSRASTEGGGICG